MYCLIFPFFYLKRNMPYLLLSICFFHLSDQALEVFLLSVYKELPHHFLLPSSITSVDALP